MEPAVQPQDSGLAAAKPARAARRLDTERSTARAVLSGSQDSDVQELVNLLHNVCDVEIAAVTVPDDGQFHYLVTAGIEPLSCDSADTMCQHLMTTDEVVVVADTRADERFRTSPFVDGRMMALHFYASAPIHAPSGSIVGRLCLFDTGPKDLTPVQRQTLSTLADSVSSVLDLRQRKRDTVNAAENAAAKGAHLEVVSVASQVSHDLRVPLTALSTSLDMLHESTPDEESPLRRKLLASARRSTARMAGLVDGLLRLNDVQRGLELSDVDLGDAVTQVLTDLETVLGDATVTVGPLPTVRGDADLLVRGAAQPRQQRGEVRPAGGRSGHRGDGPTDRLRGARPRPRQRHRHRARGPSTRLRAVLPPHPHRRARHRPHDGRPRGRGPRRHGRHRRRPLRRGLGDLVRAPRLTASGRRDADLTVAEGVDEQRVVAAHPSRRSRGRTA